MLLCQLPVLFIRHALVLAHIIQHQLGVWMMCKEQEPVTFSAAAAPSAGLITGPGDSRLTLRGLPVKLQGHTSARSFIDPKIKDIFYMVYP